MRPAIDLPAAPGPTIDTLLLGCTHYPLLRASSAASSAASGRRSTRPRPPPRAGGAARDPRPRGGPDASRQRHVQLTTGDPSRSAHSRAALRRLPERRAGRGRPARTGEQPARGSGTMTGRPAMTTVPRGAATVAGRRASASVRRCGSPPRRSRHGVPRRPPSDGLVDWRRGRAARGRAACARRPAALAPAELRAAEPAYAEAMARIVPPAAQRLG